MSRYGFVDLKEAVGMDAEGVLSHIRAGEGLTVEFKRCGGTPHDDVYQTICSFANRQGGNLFLGVEDDGTVSGVPEHAALSIQRNIANVTGNPRLFNIAPVIETEAVGVGGATVVRVWVPMGPAVYSYKGVTYDRLADCDVSVSGVNQVTLLFMRKQSTYSESTVYPYVSFADFRGDLIARARELAQVRASGHLWATLSDEELLRSAKLYTRDRLTGAEGYTLASVLLLGTDEVIADVCPAYRIDAVVRREDADRYDDRLTLRTNLLDSYDALIEFGRKHLSDRFTLDGTHRVSARDVIVRELVANMLIHREYASPLPAKLVIGKDSIRTENASRSLFEGRLNLEDFNPISKNPAIAAFFKTVGYAEELGSGFRNLQKYSRLYSGRSAVMEEGDVFRAEVPLAAGSSAGAGKSADRALEALLERDGRVTASSLAQQRGVTVRTAQRQIRRMLDAGALVPGPGGEGHVYVRPS